MAGQVSAISLGEALTERHLRQWKTLFEHLTGLQLSPQREPLLRAVLEGRIAETRCSAGDYLARLQNFPAFSRREWDLLIEKMVIGETRFFRYGAPFAFIAGYLAERLRREPGQSRITAWSAGCSSGEEAYSLAMVMSRLRGGDGEQAQVSVVGTDINPQGLRLASQGVYRNILDRGVEPGMAAAFFDHLGNGSYRVKQYLRAKVAFFRHNLLEPVASSLIPPMDVISCQNVLMYLQPWRRRAVIRHLVSFMKVDGVLVLCPGDLSGWKPDNLERVPEQGVQAYRRVY